MVKTIADLKEGVAWHGWTMLTITCSVTVLNRFLVTKPAQIEPQREDCFFQDAKAGETLEATFMVYRGGKLDIKLRVRYHNSQHQLRQLLKNTSAQLVS